MEKYQCPLCNYIYMSFRGDSEGGIPENTMFENLPEDWTCPICRTSKEKFKRIDIINDTQIDKNVLQEQQIAPKNDTRFEERINNFNYDNSDCD